MPRTERVRGRPRDARAAQEAILDAAEAVFAQHGFDGARIDAIAAASGYNKSLLFHYFDDKLGLYTAVLRRSDQQGLEMQAEIFGPLSGEETITAEAFRAFIERAIRAGYDYFVTHPRFLQIFAWEQAEGWTTFRKVASQLDQSDVEHFAAVFGRAQRAGILRSDIIPVLAIYTIMMNCATAMLWLPLFRMFSSSVELSESDVPTALREQIVAQAVHTLMPDAALAATGRANGSAPVSAGATERAAIG